MNKSVDQLVFTYGTLRRGFSNHDWCIGKYLNNGVEFISEINTEPEHTMINLGFYPGVVPFKGETSIKGELYRVTNETIIENLNHLEGHYGKDHPHNYYNTTEIETEYGPAIMYTLTEDYIHPGRIITSGDWANRN